MVEKWESFFWGVLRRILRMFCFLLIAGVNVFFALCLLAVADKRGYMLNENFGTALPLLSKWSIQYSWWPWVGVAVCVVGAILSLLRKPKDNMLWHLLTVILIVELVALFLTVMAFVLPWH